MTKEDIEDIEGIEVLGDFMHEIAKTKGGRRAVRRHKRRYAPAGGTVAGQVSHTRTTRGYRGVAKRLARLNSS